MKNIILSLPVALLTILSSSMADFIHTTPPDMYRHHSIDAYGWMSTTTHVGSNGPVRLNASLFTLHRASTHRLALMFGDNLVSSTLFLPPKKAPPGNNKGQLKSAFNTGGRAKSSPDPHCLDKHRDSDPPIKVPEPATTGLLALGLLSLAPASRAFRTRKR